MNMQDVLRGFLDALYPPICLLCGQLSEGAHPTCCPECLNSFEPVGSFCCQLCGEPFSGIQGPHLCLVCIKRRQPFRECRGAFLYSGALAKALSKVKYGGKAALLEPLENALLGEMECSIPLPDVDFVVPVPLSWHGRWKRGFNQSFILGSAVARHAGVKVVTGALQKRGNRKQVGLTAKGRARNAAASFYPGRHIDRVDGKRVLLFDDVYTTGATVRVCSRILRRAGATVFVLTLARAEFPCVR